MTRVSHSIRLKPALSRCLAAFAALLLAGFASGQVVTNGDFEDSIIGPPYISTNPSTVPGWARFGSVGDGLLVRVGYSDPDGSVTTAGHGNQFAILGGGQNGAASASWRNTVTGLTPNTAYTLSFMIANEGEASSQSLTVSFPIGSSTAPQTFSTSTGAFQNYWKSWESKSMGFTTAANSTAVTIDFSVNQRYDIGLDNIRVTPVSSGVTVLSGPVMTKSVSDPTNNCPTSIPNSVTSFTQNDPLIVVWFVLGGLNAGSNVLVRFSDNTGTVVPALDNSYQIPAAGSYRFCPGFLPNGAAGVGTWTVQAYVNGGPAIFALPFQITAAGGGGGGVTVDLLSVFRQLNLAAASYTNTDVLAPQGLTIVPNAQGQVPSGAPLGTGTLLIGAVGTNQVNPPGTASTAQFIGPNFTSNTLNCVTLLWTGNGSLTGFSATRIGVSNGGSIPAWAMYAYSASGALVDTKGEGNISTGGFSQPSTYASFTLSSSTPIARVVLCSHNGSSTYGVVPFSAGTSLSGGGTGGGGGGGTTVSAIPGTANIPGTADIFAAGRTSVPNLTGGGGTLPPAFAIPAGSAGKAVTVTNVSGFLISCSSCTTQITPDGTNMPTNIDPTADSGQQAQFQIGISGIQHDTTGGFLTGVFTGDQVPSSPSAVKRIVTSETSAASIAPALNQTFFVGDGLTGTGTGAVQQFIIPTGATRFYLGFADSNFFQGYPGYYGDNSGQETATVNIVTATGGGGTGGTGGGGGTSGGACRVDITSAKGANYNLTTEGTADWYFMGLSNAPTGCQTNGPISGSPACAPALRKSGGSSLSNLTFNSSVANNTGYVHLVSDPRSGSWSDGTPTRSGTTSGAVSIEHGGFKFTAPADQQQRTLMLHVGGYPRDPSANLTLTAHIDGLQDQTMTQVIDASANANNEIDFKIVYQAPQAGQITVSLQVNHAFDEAVFEAVALSQPVSGSSCTGAGTGGTGGGGGTGTGGGTTSLPSGNILLTVGNTGTPFSQPGTGKILMFTPTGTPAGTLNDQASANGSMGFDNSGNLYVANRDSGTLSKFDAKANLVASNFAFTYPGDDTRYPQSITTDTAGNIYVGGPGGNLGDPRGNIYRFSPTGGAAAKVYFALCPEGDGGTNWIDLAADQHTLLYDCAQKGVYSLDLNQTPSSPNASLSYNLVARIPPASDPAQERQVENRGHALRIIPSGPYAGDLLVATQYGAILVNPNIPIPATYTPSCASPSGPLLKCYANPATVVPKLGYRVSLSLDPSPNGITDFWMAEEDSGTVWKVNIATGNIDPKFTFNCNCTQPANNIGITGILVAGEQTAGSTGKSGPGTTGGGGAGGGGGTGGPGGGGGTSGGACRVDITSAKGANYNLTTEGTADWYVMGISNAPTGCQTNGSISGSPVCAPVQRKSGGSSLSNLTLYSSVANNTGYVHLVADPRTGSWSDGAPAQSGTTSGAVSIEHGGFKFTAPADQQQRTLMLHVGGYPRDPSANLTLTAHIDGLQDQTVTQVIDASANANNEIDFKIVYQAPQAGQITVSLQVNHAFDEAVFQAVALSQPVSGSSCTGTGTGGTGGGGGTGTGGGGGTVTVNSPPKQFPPAGGTGTVTATPPTPGTTVTATPSVPWIIIIDVSGGTITFSVPPNTGDGRVGTISIAAGGAIPAIVPVSQNAPNAGTGTGGCTYPLQSNTVQGFDVNGNTPGGGSTGLIRFLTAPACPWTAAILYASTSTGWITIQPPGSSGVGNGAISFSLAPNTTGNTRVGAIVVQGQVTLITQDGGPPPGTPVISSGGIVNAASYASGGPPNGLAQGSFFSIFGSGLGPDQFLQAGYPIPTTLGGVSVQIVSGGTTSNAYLLFVSAGQINGLIPSNVPVGPAQVIVTYNGKSSALANIVISKTSFGVFYQAVNGNNVAVAQNVRTSTDYPLNVPSAPAKPGQIVIFWGTGLFPINGPDNVAPGANARDITEVPITITVGGLPSQKLYAGRQAESAGVDNIYFTLPPNVPLGCNVPVAITVNGVAANMTTIAISADGSPCSNTPANNNKINTTLTISGSGTVTTTNISASGTVTLSGLGTGTLTSNFNLASAAVSGSAPLTLNITSGSRTGSLTATLTGSLTLLSQVFSGDPSSSGPATITVTSGTGGFAGTTGAFSVTAAGTGRGTTGSGGGTFSISGPGTLTIP